MCKSIKFYEEQKDPRGKGGTPEIDVQVKNIQVCTECELGHKLQPEVKAHNSSHMIVSWASIFQGCKYFKVEDVAVILDDQRTNSKFELKNCTISV